jgi:hypothetical protein
MQEEAENGQDGRIDRKELKIISAPTLGGIDK